jgi:V-type H+-transporting ATPase subunit a
MYNDMMSIPLEVFGSGCYTAGKITPEPECVYPVGIDPRWFTSSNSITFVNSLKMKLSVIIAVSQMSLGVLMKAFNAVHNHSKIDFMFEFVPQIIMLLALFGYMDALIIIKWLTDYRGHENLAPSIINTMINIPLKGAHIEGQPFISDMQTNKNISLVLLFIAII